MDKQTIDRERRAQEIFQQSLGIGSVPERCVFARAAGHGDEALIARVEELLQQSIEDSFLEEAVCGSSTLSGLVKDFEKPGDLIGGYTLLHSIGEGGCGVVYAAEQTKPIRRKVAMKLIKIGMDTRSVVARFDAERTALSMMDHPNIAKVLDAGCTPSGRPYFVMELVGGIKITDFCNQEKLSVSDRLGLFVQVCRAVQHAHQKGIIHRDLKPGNVLVAKQDGVAVPKVIDFGIAKAMAGRLSEATLVTQVDHPLGTPAYMSPEQASMAALDVDTRSDIYSLGVLLYELLCNQTPFRADHLRASRWDEVKQIIREKVPLRPSICLSRTPPAGLREFALLCGTTPVQLLRRVRGDLDLMVMKALEKDRTRRYQTSLQFAADVECHLESKPIAARAPNFGYRLQKAFQRHKGVIAAAAVVLMVAIIGVGLTLWQSLRANRVLEELRASAPTFAEQARALALEGRFGEAEEKFSYASNLRADVPEYFKRQGDMLVYQLKFGPASEAYRKALKLDPASQEIVAISAACDQLSRETSLGQKPAPESLEGIYGLMTQFGRASSELMPLAKMVGKEQQHLKDYWVGQLSKIPGLSYSTITNQRIVEPGGTLSLDLSASDVTDLRPLQEMPLSWLSLNGCRALSNLAPLRSMQQLRWLDLARTSVNDLATLRDLRLEYLLLSWTDVRDLSPLRGMPLKTLDLHQCRVSDLTPLAGMPLVDLSLQGTSVWDLSPLVGLPLESLDLSWTPVGDLKALGKLPLKHLDLQSCGRVFNFAALSAVTSLESLVLPGFIEQLPLAERKAIGELRKLPKLEDISEGNGVPSLPAKAFWRRWDSNPLLLSRLSSAESESAYVKLADGSFRFIAQKTLTNIDFLADAPVSQVVLAGSRVTDLAPLKGLPLRKLDIGYTRVSDLSPLIGMPLEHLYMRATRVSDLTPLRTLPLREINLLQCVGITNVAPLAEVRTLESIALPITAVDVQTLRALPNLQRIGYGESGGADEVQGLPSCSSLVFWQKWDGIPWAARLASQGADYHAYQESDGDFFVRVGSFSFEDCSIFRGANIRVLDLHDTAVRNLEPLRDCVGLKRLYLPATGTNFFALRSVTNLEVLSFVRSQFPNREQTSGAFWRDTTTQEAFQRLNLQGVEHRSKVDEMGRWTTKILSTQFNTCVLLQDIPIRSLDLSRTAVTELGPLGKMQDLEDLRIDDTLVSELAPLRGMHLVKLRMMRTPVRDLEPLRGMKLKELFLVGTRAQSFEALRGMPLERVQFNRHLSDLSVLEGMPIRELHLGACVAINELAPLVQCRSLERLLLPKNIGNVDALRLLPRLEWLSAEWDDRRNMPSLSAEEFWATREAARENSDL